VALLSTIRDGLKTRLATIVTLRCYDVWPDAPNLPAAIVRPARATYGETFSDESTIHLEVVLLTQIANLPRAQDTLDAYLATTGASSVKEALEDPASGAIGGGAESVAVRGWRDYGPMEVGDIVYFGVVFDVEVFAS
jgi:hypothetical protein